MLYLRSIRNQLVSEILSSFHFHENSPIDTFRESFFSLKIAVQSYIKFLQRDFELLQLLVIEEIRTITESPNK